MKSQRLGGLPEELRRNLVEARRRRHWSQAELSRRVGLPQVHISEVETGKVVPRYDTLRDLVRVLDYDLVLAPRPLVSAIQALIRDFRQPGGAGQEEGERPLYATSDEPESQL